MIQSCLKWICSDRARYGRYLCCAVSPTVPGTGWIHDIQISRFWDLSVDFLFSIDFQIISCFSLMIHWCMKPDHEGMDGHKSSFSFGKSVFYTPNVSRSRKGTTNVTGTGRIRDIWISINLGIFTTSVWISPRISHRTSDIDSHVVLCCL